MFKDRVEFMEVECSANDDTTSFCTRNSIQSYPTLILFTGEEKIPFTHESRHIITLGTFFDEHLNDDKYFDMDAGRSKKIKKDSRDQNDEKTNEDQQQRDKDKVQDGDDNEADTPNSSPRDVTDKPKTRSEKSLASRPSIEEENEPQMESKSSRSSSSDTKSDFDSRLTNLEEQMSQILDFVKSLKPDKRENKDEL